MKTYTAAEAFQVRFFFICWLLCGLALAAAEGPVIDQFTSEGHLVWRANATNGIVVIEGAASLDNANWHPFFFDFSTNVPRGASVSTTNSASAFYRVKLQYQPPDPALILHLPFDSPFDEGILMDVSGHGNHAYRFGHLSGSTNANWPSLATGIDGSRAGTFQYYYDGWSLFGRSGDYAVIEDVVPFLDMTNATVAVWAHYSSAPSGDYLEDAYANLVSAGYAIPGAWHLGRESGDRTEFGISTDSIGGSATLAWPDSTYQTDGDSGGWHHYAFTFDEGVITGYYDGVEFGNLIVSVGALTVSGYFLGIGCHTHNGDPWLEGGVDIYPNHGWLNGTMDDLRIYSRVFAASEVEELYHSYDTTAPTVPQGLRARAASPNMLELRWDPSYDRFGVVGYTVTRDTVILGDTPGVLFLDTNVVSGMTYDYRVEAFDHAGHRSDISAPLWQSAPSATTPLSIVLDEDDGLPYAACVGDWEFDGYWLPGSWDGTWKNDGNSGKGAKSVTYRPLLMEGGEYEVFLRHVQRSSYATNVPVDVEYDGGQQTVIVNQSTGGGTWKSLGRYPFAAGTGAVIRIRTDGTVRNNGNPGTVVADAVLFTR